MAFTPNASAFYTHSVSPDLKRGIGLAGNFGGQVKYNAELLL